MNKNIYLFPELKVFIASHDDREFIFGRYYENADEMRNNES